MTLKRNQAFLITLFVFSISIVLRLPNLSRPVSKHHEFISAVILINLESWQQGGGAGKFHYTPLMSFQHPGDKHHEKEIQIDSQGNQLYLSLGPGWYIIPYFFYQAFHLPVQPVYLRLLNLLFHLFTVMICFVFFERLLPDSTANKYIRVLTGCILFLLSPGPLWYFGNGYVHTAIMLPVILAILLLLLPMFQSPLNITGSRLFLLSLTVIALVYLDWFAVFLCFCTALAALLRLRKDRKYIVLATILFLSLFIGIALIFWQFASHAGIQTVVQYWRSRYFSRSFVNKEESFGVRLVSLTGHLLTCYLPLLILLGRNVVLSRIKKIPYRFSQEERVFVGIYTCSAVLYVLVLMDWASVHEFSVLPASLLLAYLGGRLLVLPSSRRSTLLLILSFFVLSVGQYYFINRPGKISRDGMAFNTYELFGKQLRQTPPEYKIFAHLPENCPMIEYYAGRNITLVQDSSAAKEMMRQWNIAKAVWVESEGFQFYTSRVISAPAGNE